MLIDSHGRDTLAIERVENGQFIKADIFDHPVSFNINEVTQVDTPEEALSAKKQMETSKIQPESGSNSIFFH